MFFRVQVEWLPYRNMDSTLIPEDIKVNLILGRSKTMLICFDKAERHLPNRCLRQYGMLQSIPEDVLRWERKSRGVDGGVDLSGKMESELNEWSNRRSYIVEGDDCEDESEYLQWYLRITRKFVGRPISLSSEFQRTVRLRLLIIGLGNAIWCNGKEINLCLILNFAECWFERYCTYSRYILDKGVGRSTN